MGFYMGSCGCVLMICRALSSGFPTLNFQFEAIWVVFRAVCKPPFRVRSGEVALNCPVVSHGTQGPSRSAPASHGLLGVPARPPKRRGLALGIMEKKMETTRVYWGYMGLYKR